MISNYVAHVSWQVHLASSEIRAACAECSWTGPWLPSLVGFADGAKLGRWQPEDEAEQQVGYDGRKHCHCFAILAWADVLGRYTRIDITELGTSHDRKVCIIKHVLTLPLMRAFSPG